MPAASSGGVYGEGASASQPSTGSAGVLQEERGPGRAGAGDADDVDALADRITARRLIA